MKVSGVNFRAEGLVLVMHSDIGMGIEFSQATEPQRNDLEKFIQALTNTKGVLPELLVEPEGLETGEPAAVPPSAPGTDPLVELFRKKADLAPEAFQSELRKQRSPKAAAQKASI